MAMIQYDLWNNCSNQCDFCLIYRKRILNKEEMIQRIDQIIENIDYVGERWKTQFSDGISLLGGELYFITDPDVQNKFMELIDHIIDKILLPNKDKCCKYSTVTNGIYKPEFLFRVIDHIVERAGIQFVDVNFSYDLKYRFHSEESRLLCLDNMRKFSERYNYRIGAQMVVTSYLIDMINNKEFDISEFQNKIVPNSIVEFLYPHEVHTGKVLDDFQFTRDKFIKFLKWLKANYFENFMNYYYSITNSSIFKYTGLYINEDWSMEIEPKLSDGKEIINPDCGHSVLYQCYKDSNKCILCDITKIKDTLKN
ncbi:MAG: hypothetical protein J5691_00440 [Bacilli bacterium]|nr:hypothetical protein [Bacilli bacterium]